MPKYKLYERKRGRKSLPKMKLKAEGDYPPKYKIHKRPRPSSSRKPNE